MHFSMRRQALFYLLIGSWILSACSIPEIIGSIKPTPQSPEGEPTSLPAASPEPTKESQIISGETAAPTQATSAFSPISHSAPDCGYGGEFKTISALDARTVQFTLCYPDVAFLSKISLPSFGILPAEWIEVSGGGGKGSPLLLSPVGSGPYRFEEWLPGEQLSFLSFDDYWGEEKAAVNRLVFHWDLDDSQRLLELQTGTVQGIDSPNPQDYSSISTDPTLRLSSRAPLSVVYLGMNNTYPPLDNQLIRQAIALALDRQAIVDEFFPAGFEVAEFFTPCVVPNGCVGEAWYGFDPQKGRELMAEAGYPDGFQTQISYRNVVRGYITQPDLTAEAIRDQLKKNLNISAKLVPIDSPQFLQAADDGLLPGVFLMGWGADYPDVSNFLDTHFSEQASKMLGNPFSDILNPLREGRSTADDEGRKAAYTLANNAIRQHIPLIPLAYGGWVNPQTLAAAYNRSVTGAYADPLGLERFAEMGLTGQDELSWMQSYEPLSLYCADETDTETLRACAQVIETLYRFQSAETRVEPALAEACKPNADLTIWTCLLRSEVSFHDGSELDANDVVTSFLVQWDASHPLHKGRMGEFAYFENFFGAFLNAAAP